MPTAHGAAPRQLATVRYAPVSRCNLLVEEIRSTTSKSQPITYITSLPSITGRERQSAMDAITALTTRASAFKIIEPGPRAEDLETILSAAIRAPDHGRLRPWRFLTIEGAARDKLGRAMAEMQAQDKPDTPPDMLARTAAKPLRAPLIVAVIATVQTDHPKVPEIEQILSAGSAAQNIMLAAHALGYGCAWKTGGICYDSRMKATLGIAPSDHIIGFMYLGTIDAGAQMEIERPDLAPHISAWT